MADIDLKTESPDASINDSAFLFGADSQSAASPSVYSVGTVRAHFVGAGTLNVASGKTLTASNTLTLAGTDGTTMTFPSTSATLARTDAGNTFTGAQTFSIGTVNGTGLNLTQTWSGTGTYTGLQYNVTDSGPSNAASLLLDLQVGGSSVCQISKAGMLSVRTGSYNNPGLRFGYTGNNGLYWSSGLFVLNGGTLQLQTSDSAVTLLGDIPLSRRAAANLRLGAADTTGTTAPTAQTLSVQSWASSTNNNQPGANFTITGSQGTGTGAGGSIIFQVAPAGATANGVQNALATALTINSDRTISTADVSGQTTIAPGQHIIKSTTAYPKLVGVNFQFTNTANLGSGYFFCEPRQLSFGAADGTNFVSFYTDAANTLALRNGTNAQTFRVYNTYTSDTNYERAEHAWFGNEYFILTARDGSGSDRNIVVRPRGQLVLGAGAQPRWRITTAGDLITDVDNTVDIGAASATRPRNIYAGTSIRATGATAVIGYGTGSGGAVTQATSRTTGVTLNKANGQITLVSAAGTATWQSFTVTNSTVAATDTIIVNQDTGTDKYQIFVTNVAAGSFEITFATTGGTTTEQPVFSFAVIKAVTS